MRVVENDSQVSCLTCLGDDVATDGNEEVCRRDRFGGEGITYHLFSKSFN